MRTTLSAALSAAWSAVIPAGRRQGASGGRRRRVHVPARPVVATPRVVAWATGGLFGLGSLVVLTATLVAPDQFARLGLLRLLATVATLIGLLSAGWGRRLRPAAAHAFVAAGTALITAGVAVSGSSPAAATIACLYVLVAVDAAFFFSWPAALGHLGAAVSLGTLLLSRFGGWGAAAALLIGGVAVLVAVVVAWLVRAAGAAEVDTLTGLVNRKGLDRLLDDAVEQATSSGRPLCAAVVDVDHFKAVNDSVGHSGGDQLLAGLARAWSGLLPAGAVLARQGGDEFVALLPGHALPAAVAFVQELRAATPAPYTCSVGVAQFDVESRSTLLTDADQALYNAKRAGRNRVHHAASAVTARAEVRRALTRGELAVFHQPVVDLGDGAVVGTEALLRWRHPHRGLLPPAQFLPLVQDSGLMPEVGRLVLAEACAQTAARRARGGPATVAVNVTGGELLAEDYVDVVLQILQRTGLPADALVLEVTEASFDADTNRARAALARLRAAGVRVAVDDFGTGYSSLARLAHLPVDILKIDQSFVRGLGPDDTAAPLVQAILALADALGLDVVAEGVEHGHQAALLRDWGCPHAQGYLFGRPAPDGLLSAATPGPAALAPA